MKTQHGIAVLALLLPGILTGCGVGEASVAEASEALRANVFLGAAIILAAGLFALWRASRANSGA